MKKIRLGIIDLGGRIYDLMKATMFDYQDLEINALCDISKENMQKAAALIKEKLSNTPAMTRGLS